MEGKNNKKELTLNDLARMMSKEFEESRESTKKLVHDKIEELARMTNESFSGVEEYLSKIDGTLENMEANLNKKVDTFTHKDLEIRVEKVEEKLDLKPKLKYA